MIYDGHELLIGIGFLLRIFAAILVFETTVPHQKIRIADSGDGWFDLVGFNPAFLACIAQDITSTEAHINAETTQA